MAEQRHQLVIGDGLTASQAADKTAVARRTLRFLLARYEAGGLEGLRVRIGRCRPHQTRDDAKARGYVHLHWTLIESSSPICMQRSGVLDH